MPLDIDMARVAELIRDVAEAEILPRFRDLAPHQVRSKTHPGDLVTDADIEAEKALAAVLPPLLPGSIVVGEEGAHADPTLAERLKEPDVVAWVLDPVDGTSNFAKGNPQFGVIVALVVGGRTVAGWIHEPVTGRTVWAAEGEGTWDGNRRLAIPLHGEPLLSEMRGSVACRNVAPLRAITASVHRMGSAAHVYLAMVDGAIDFATFRNLNPWDHAAGVLMVREAGGVARHLDDGTPYSPVPSRKGLMLALSDEKWDELAPAARQSYGFH